MILVIHLHLFVRYSHLLLLYIEFELFSVDDDIGPVLSLGDCEQADGF